MRQSSKHKDKLSTHITMYEATKSGTAIRRGIDNTPNPEELQNMKELAENVFEPLRRGLGGYPIGIASFFRCEEVNAIIGGSTRSQHMAKNGAAMDIDVDGSDYLYNYQIFEYIKNHLEWDQMIWEFGDKFNPDWVHVSYKKGANRKQVLVAYRENGKTKYKTYTP